MKKDWFQAHPSFQDPIPLAKPAEKETALEVLDRKILDYSLSLFH